MLGITKEELQKTLHAIVRIRDTAGAMIEDKQPKAPDQRRTWYKQYMEDWELVTATIEKLKGLGISVEHSNPCNNLARLEGYLKGAASTLGGRIGILAEFYYPLEKKLKELLTNQELNNKGKTSDSVSRKSEFIDKISDSVKWDVFICHASEDKEFVVEPLAKELTNRGLRIWYDRHVLRIGDSLRRKIDEGLANSRFGIVVLSPDFFRKEWPQRELDGLIQREVMGQKVILPVWHNITREDVARYSAPLADKMAASTNKGVGKLAEELVEVIVEHRG